MRRCRTRWPSVGLPLALHTRASRPRPDRHETTAGRPEQALSGPLPPSRSPESQRQHFYATAALVVVLTSESTDASLGILPAALPVGRYFRKLLGALGNQDDLADVAPLGDEAVGVGRPVEREGLGNDWLQLSLLERRYQRLNHPVEASLDVPP